MRKTYLPGLFSEMWFILLNDWLHFCAALESQWGVCGGWPPYDMQDSNSSNPDSSLLLGLGNKITGNRVCFSVKCSRKQIKYVCHWLFYWYVSVSFFNLPFPHQHIFRCKLAAYKGHFLGDRGRGQKTMLMIVLRVNSWLENQNHKLKEAR